MPRRMRFSQPESRPLAARYTGNSKKKEVAPDGGKDECVFDIMQGVAITLMVKRGKKTAEACAHRG